MENQKELPKWGIWVNKHIDRINVDIFKTALSFDEVRELIYALRDVSFEYKAWERQKYERKQGTERSPGVV